MCSPRAEIDGGGRNLQDMEAAAGGQALRIPDLAGRAVLVTGSSTGIGAAVARGFGAQGARVAVHGYSHGEAAEAVVASIRAAGGTAFALRGDVRDPAACAALVAEAHRALGGLDVLVNNAAVTGSMPQDPTTVDPDVIRTVVETNVIGVVRVTNAMLPLLRRSASRRGIVCNIISQWLRVLIHG